ncbi:MAG: hypothetical protein WCX88_03270, partial [Patescibacteria group bacterium]
MPNLPQRLLALAERLSPEDADACREAARVIERLDDYQAVFDELERARRKFPTWPNDPLHAVGVVGEEFGELTKAVLQHTYEPQKSSLDDVRSESIQTAAMALRFFVSLRTYQFAACAQHMQTGYSTEQA